MGEIFKVIIYLYVYLFVVLVIVYVLDMRVYEYKDFVCFVFFKIFSNKNSI